MKHIVFLLSNYKPNSTATSNCAFNIIQSLKGEYEITVICLHHGRETYIKEKLDDINIIRIRDNYEYLYHFLKGKLSKAQKQPYKFMYSILFNCLRLISFITFCFKSVSLRKVNIKLYYGGLIKLNKSNKIHAIIPVSLSFETVVAAYKYKKKEKETIMIPYLFDPFTQNIPLHKSLFFSNIRKKRHLKIEKQILNLADKVFILPQLTEIFSQIPFNEFSSKIIITEHPLLEKYDSSLEENIFSESIKINIVYTGTLYKDIRNPNYLLTLYQLSGAHKLSELHMYTSGNCDTILYKFKNTLKDSLILHGSVQYNKARSAMNNADILISLGNTISYQIPSKIFEYISTGKPIVHIYSIDDDKVIDILKDYPLALCLKDDLDQIETNSKKFYDFCISNSGKVISFDNIKEYYFSALPETTAKLFSELLE